MKDVLPPIPADVIGGDVTPDPPVDPTEGAGLGAPCEADPLSGASECRLGLICVDGACAFVGDTQENDFCIATAECDEGLYCAYSGRCEPAGVGAEGSLCADAGQCAAGLFCRLYGLTGVCTPGGVGDLHAPCADTTECLAALVCDGAGQCSVGSPTFGFDPWPGVACAPADAGASPRFHFELGGVGDDFFRLPFPSDIRAVADGLDLAGFPSPGVGAIGLDLAANVVEAAEALGGFSPLSTVYFRFSTGIDFSTISGSNADGPPTVHFLNVDEDSPAYGSGPKYSWFLTDGGGRYICPRWLGLSAASDRPLSPGTTYAAFITRGVSRVDGVEYVPDTGFQAMMASTPPADVAAAAAWETFTPLRTYLDASGDLDRADVLVATVFTTASVSGAWAAVRAAVSAAPAPAITDLAACDEGALSPCDDGLMGEAHVRGCFGSSDAYWELHMRVELPVIQAGTRPYLTPSDGGGLVQGDAGVELQGTEPVCVSLAVPRHAPTPSSGWPVVIYGHETGGTFRTAVDRLADALTSPAAGAEAPAAVLSWDAPMHGDRRGSTLPPAALYMNVGNPAAAVGNHYQAGADIFALVGALHTLDWSAEESPTGAALRLDGSKVAYVGRGRGAEVGAVAGAYAPEIGLFVFAGAGAGLAASFLDVTSPATYGAGLSYSLQEVGDQGPVTLDARHPVLGLLQMVLDPVDPVHHLHKLVSSPPAAGEARHVLQVLGLDDTWMPTDRGGIFAQRLDVPLIGPVLESVGGLEVVDPPISLNLGDATKSVTAGAVQGQLPGGEGHDVLFEDSGLRSRVMAFTRQWLGGADPVVEGAP